MNQIQMNYINAKNDYETAKEFEKRAETTWIKRNGLKNPDGTTPDCLRRWRVSPEAREAAKAEYLADAGQFNQKRTLEAMARFTKAENALFDWAISLLPESQRTAAMEAAESLTHRARMIDLALHEITFAA